MLAQASAVAKLAAKISRCCFPISFSYLRTFGGKLLCPSTPFCVSLLHRPPHASPPARTCTVLARPRHCGSQAGSGAGLVLPFPSLLPLIIALFPPNPPHAHRTERLAWVLVYSLCSSSSSSTMNDVLNQDHQPEELRRVRVDMGTLDRVSACKTKEG